MALEGVFKVPEKQPAGTVNVQFVGDQGTVGSASYTADYSGVDTTTRRVISVVTTNYDPLAQTFTLSEVNTNTLSKDTQLLRKKTAESISSKKTKTFTCFIPQWLTDA